MKKKKRAKSVKQSVELTDQQLKVLRLICKELSATEISKRLKISKKTFFNHRAMILMKTKAKGNIGLYKYALKHSLVKG
jgi:DNA-binding CsgD family transcriptional regulator